MANPEHLAILKKGVKEWNAWRRNTAEQWHRLGLLSDEGVQAVEAAM